MLAGMRILLALAALWHPPVPGDVARPFAYERAAPFARGAHRGVDLATRAGARVGAPCAGTVTHAGPVPGHRRGVTIRCGALTATVLDLTTTTTARGARTHPGTPLGRAAGPSVHVGARRAGDPFAYVPPPLAADRPPDDLGPAPPPRPREPRPRPAPLPVRTPAPDRAPAPIPTPAWVGLALLLAAAPTGALTGRRHRRRRGALARA